MPIRSAALARAQAFAPNMGRHYAAKRNYDFGPDDRSNVSALSPHIRHRLILEDELAQIALKHHSPDAAEKFLQEVFWRTYWKGWLQMRPSVWAEYKAERDGLLSQLATNGGLRNAYEHSVQGQTGIACFDAWALELKETGYLHNHARMWFASIWIFTLGLPWALGADFFLRHLLDGDAASNTLSWRWVAGLQTRGKTYLARASNIAEFTAGRFEVDPGRLAPDAPPLDGPDNPAAGRLPIGAARPKEDYALLLHEDDSCFETLDLPKPPSEVFVQDKPAQRSPYALSPAATAFTQGALDDAAHRAQQAFECPVDRMDSLSAPTELPVYAPYAPVGPLADGAPSNIQWIIRPIDAYLWPYATKGFFNFKKAIPQAIEAFGWG